MFVLLFVWFLVASSWAFCPPPGGPCGPRGPCGPVGGPCGGLPPRLPPALPQQPYSPIQQPFYPQGQLPAYSQSSLYGGGLYYQPRNLVIKETAVIKKPTTDSNEEEYSVTPPTRPFEESTESAEILNRPELPLYPQGPPPREIPLIPQQPLPLGPQQPYPQPFPQQPLPQQPYPAPCGPVPYPPGRPIYPQPPLPQPQPGGYPYPPPPYPPRQPYPQPQPLPYPQPPPRPYPTNDCCGRCAAPCRFRNRHARAYDAKHVSSKEIASASDPKCSSDKLRAILKKNMVENLSIAKRLIQKAAEEKFGGQFNVICSREDFTYVSRSSQFCLHEHKGHLCYAFQS
ncbi:hypothetical protein L596_021553 [Steinernema carpocapsae]|uniref:Ground-like domain-containing protein n=1 Tax=Steinernema carpocapsae TaxID=34508 RepID=A0A4V5ZZY5_STECR|nr:hypothetical protein L596_021553 [Steinernema carpocapsae]